MHVQTADVCCVLIASRRLDQALGDIRLTRYFVDLPLAGQSLPRLRRSGTAVPKARPFDPSGSLWGPRATYADSRELLDTTDVELRRFEREWRVLLELGVQEVVMREDDDIARLEAGLISTLDADNNSVPDECDDVGECLWQHRALLKGIFLYYASLSASRHDLSLVERHGIDLERLNLHQVIAIEIRIRSECRPERRPERRPSAARSAARVPSAMSSECRPSAVSSAVDALHEGL